MRVIEALWDDLVAAESAEREREVASKIHRELSNRDVYLEIQAQDASGTEVLLEEMADTPGVRVQVRFTSGGRSFDAPAWKPVVPSNVFLLMRE